VLIILRVKHDSDLFFLNFGLRQIIYALLVAILFATSSALLYFNYSIPVIQAAPSQTGHIYYISPNGSDSGIGAIDSPWKTIAHAVPQLTPGDTLYARGGTYSGQRYRWASPSGISGSPITFAAYPGETPVFDGQGAIDQFLGIMGADWIVIDGLTIQNYTAKMTGAIWMGRPTSTSTNFAEHITIRNNTILNIGTKPIFDHAIYISWGNRDILIENNFIKDVTAECVLIAPRSPGLVDGVRVIGNILQNCQNNGIYMSGGPKNIEIRKNIFYNNANGIDMFWGPAASNVVIENNVFVGASNYAMRIGTFNFGDIVSDSNLYFDNHQLIVWSRLSLSLASYRDVSGNGTNSIEANPIFVNPDQDDFRLRTGSPAEAILRDQLFNLFGTVPTPNRPPTVNAGTDARVTLASPATASLTGIVTDDGLPTLPGVVTTTWTHVSGPGSVTFADPSALATAATFVVEGSYVLRLTASDGETDASDELTITVTSDITNQPPTVSAYYISPNGSDSGIGAIDSPWKTIAHAVPRLTPGDTLYARGGTYSGQRYTWASPSGISGSPITFAAYPGETPVFDGQGANMNFLQLVGVDWIVVDGLTIQNYRTDESGCPNA